MIKVVSMIGEQVALIRIDIPSLYVLTDIIFRPSAFENGLMMPFTDPSHRTLTRLGRRNTWSVLG